MSRSRFPLVQLIEQIGGTRGMTCRKVRRLYPAINPASVPRILKRLRRQGILSRTKLKTGGRPAFNFQLTRMGYDILELLGIDERRYGVCWKDLAALAPAVKVLKRTGSLQLRKPRRVPAWKLNRHLFA